MGLQLKNTLVDSHCHLNFADFGGDLDQVIERAREGGVSHMVTICTKLDEERDVRNIADSYPHIFYSVGIHPHESMSQESMTAEELAQKLIESCDHPKCIGLGETGLDYYYALSPVEQQRKSFLAHMIAAEVLDLPVIIHARDADDDIIEMLKERKGRVRGVFHCFSGSWELAQAALDLGYYLSFSGILTFKNADGLREVAAQAPIDRIMIETDSPYLAPVPMRGKRNEPANVLYTAQVLAQVKGMSVDEVALATTNNFFSLFTKARPQV